MKAEAVTLHYVSSPGQLAQFTAVDRIGRWRCEHSRKQLSEKGMIGEWVNRASRHDPTGVESNIVERSEYCPLTLIERRKVDTGRAGLLDAIEYGFSHLRHRIRRRDPVTDRRFNYLAGQLLQLRDRDPSAFTNQSIERPVGARLGSAQYGSDVEHFTTPDRFVAT